MGLRSWAALAVITVTWAGAGTAHAFEAKGSVEQVSATGLQAGAPVTLKQGARTIATQPANELGGALFRDVEPGGGYTLTQGGATSAELTVLDQSPAPPSTDVYESQKLPSRGYGYLKTRDGTELSIFVHPPQDVLNAVPNGRSLPELPRLAKTPTLIEYGGYGYADPYNGPQSGIALLANLMGFTVVNVNMRGTGCSGGAFDFFEPLQGLDGYDVVETVARQDWVAHGKVGMMGISYGGISQLFTAQHNPPSLAAISPLSVIDQTQTTLYPGGILNTGFAVAWAKERIHDALPASENGGQKWAHRRIQEGDETCRANQALHPEAVDLMAKIRANDHYVPEVADPLAPLTFVNKIKAPTFMACQWTDEQTGGHCPTLARRMTHADKKWFTFTNGTHIDSLAPETFNRWYDFLQLYVARQAPATNAALVHAGAPLIYSQAYGITPVTLPPDPIQLEPTYDGALKRFEAQKPVRVLFDNGAGSQPGHPVPGYEHSFDRFPAPGTKARSFHLGSDGALTQRKPRRRGVDTFTADPKAGPPTNFTGNTAAGEGGLWTATPPYGWQPHAEKNALAYTTAPLAENTTVLGAGALEAYVRADRPDVDLQATISEIRPDGKETFVQGGWLKASARKLDPAKSTLLEPVLSLRKRDIKPLPAGRFSKVTIPLYYQGHAYRKGSRLRVTLSAPNGDQPIWSFAEATGPAKVEVARDRRMPSRLVLPVVPGLEVPTELPPCPGLRGQPCR